MAERPRRCTRYRWSIAGYGTLVSKRFLQFLPWIGPLAEELNMTQVIKGWSQNGKNSTSFFNIPELSARKALAIALEGGAPKEIVKTVTTGHESNSTDIHTPETILLVNELYHDDFVLGGYKMRDAMVIDTAFQ